MTLVFLSDYQTLKNIIFQHLLPIIDKLLDSTQIIGLKMIIKVDCQTVKISYSYFDFLRRMTFLSFLETAAVSGLPIAADIPAHAGMS